MHLSTLKLVHTYKHVTCNNPRNSPPHIAEHRGYCTSGEHRIFSLQRNRDVFNKATNRQFGKKRTEM